jgi:uncharacterized repeat protein (TIGR04076 family)
MPPWVGQQCPPSQENEQMPVHSIVRVTVLSVKPLSRTCRIYEPGDVFYVRQHLFDVDISSVKGYCYHSLRDLYDVYTRVRQGPVGGKEVFDCRDNGLVRFEVARLDDEDTLTTRIPNQTGTS